MTRINFQVVELKGVHRWKDDEGKTKQKTKRFSQTINPFNKNAAGQIKTYDEIMAELKIERAAWLKGDFE